jgi:transcriptional regulator with XRE-family HTH domain
MVKLAELRRGRGWSQARLAQEVGVSRTAVSLWEMDGPTGSIPHEPARRLLGYIFSVPWESIEFGSAKAHACDSPS